MVFIPKFEHSTDYYEEAWWFIFRENEMLVKEKHSVIEIPSTGDIDPSHFQTEKMLCFGHLNDKYCIGVEVDNQFSPTDGMFFRRFRSLFSSLGEEIFWIAGFAYHLLYWSKNTLYCGHCGSRMKIKNDERAKECPQCGLIQFPRISPAVIVAVYRDKEILLARAKRFPFKLYSVLAGFVEPGEDLESCIRREVKEEVGIEIKNIQYFGSQPWPFPDALMIGFMAEYAGGEIKIFEDEIEDAGWFAQDSLPRIPEEPSIARKMIDAFFKNKNNGISGL